MKLYCKHELKNCPRCNTEFECKPGDITNCQCNGIVLNTDTVNFINKKYGDCLCKTCLLQLNDKQLLFGEKFGHSPH